MSDATPFVSAPWTDAQVNSINEYQAAGWFHPFTCGGEHETHVNLIAANAGLRCADPHCAYTQGWVHDFMANGEWRKHRPFSVPESKENGS